MPTRDTVLVVARPGLMRESLVAFLAATLGMGSVRVVDDPSRVDAWLRPEAPRAIIIDASLGQDAVIALLRRLRADEAPVRCLILTDDAWPHEAFLSAGADEVFVKGFLGDDLRRAVLGHTGLSIPGGVTAD